MTLVVIDTLAIQDSSGGIRIHLRELLKAATDSEFHFQLICSRSNYKTFADLPVDRIVRVPWSTHNRWLRILTQQVLVPYLAWRISPDVLLAPVDIAPLAAPVPVVTCIHSSHLNVRHGYASLLQGLYNRIFLWATVRRSSALIVISSFVRQATEEMFPSASGKMSVVYHGGGLIEKARKTGWCPPPDDMRSGGILFVGTLHRHKRPDSLLRAYARLRRTYGARTPPLYIVGDDRAAAAAWLQEMAADEGIEEFVLILGRVTDDHLLELYGDARVLVLPSVVEGFGLPVIEAMQAAVPVVIADRCALPEIAGGAALLANPDDEADLAKQIAAALWNPEVRAQAIAKGLERGTYFNWPRCAREVLLTLRSAIESKPVPEIR